MIYIICQKFVIYNYFEHVMEILLDISERIIKKKNYLFKFFFIFLLLTYLLPNIIPEKLIGICIFSSALNFS